VLNYEADTTWYLEEFSREKDTIHWYLRQLPSDTIELVILYEGDTLGMEYMRTDPVRKTPGLERRRKTNKEEEIEYLGLRSRLRGGTIRPDQQPEFVFAHPVAEVLSDSILLVFGEDSTYNPTYMFLDSLNLTLRFPVEVPEETKYSIVIPDSSFIDWNGLYNKKQNFRYASKSLREYGVLTLNMKPEVAQPYIVQLLTEKESVVRELYFTGDTALHMLYLDPGSYKLKVIFDDNGNRKWDPGFYSMQLQPEKVIYFSKMAVIRGNWDLEEEWRIFR
jgi:hypothetical protein